MPHRSKVVFLALAFVSTMVSARVPVEVSKEYAHILLDKTATLPGNENLGEVMYPTPSADSYFVTVVTDGPGASVETYRTVDLDRNDKSKMVSYGEVSGTWTKWFNFPAQYGTGTLVVVRPPVQGRLHARLQIVRYGTRTPEQREGLANVIRAPLEGSF